MRPIGKITAPECELVVLELTTDEHNQLHAGPKDFVNTKNLFGKPVHDVALHPDPHPKRSEAAAETWLSMIVHKPGCTCAATCTELP